MNDCPVSEPLLLYYPKCSTCVKALKWLAAEGFEVRLRDIVAQPPTEAELTAWVGKSTFPLSRFFNTSGRLYREPAMKARIATADDSGRIRLLASDGMLVKRPLLVTPKGVCPGFKEELWQELLR